VIDVLSKYVLCPDYDLKEDQSKPTAGGSQTRTMVWLEEDHDGQPMPKRRRTGEKRKRSSATGLCFCFVCCLHQLIVDQYINIFFKEVIKCIFTILQVLQEV